MSSEVHPRCAFDDCNYFKLNKASRDTKLYIINECRERLIERMRNDSSFTEDDCPQAALAAAVITELAVREEEITILEEI